MLKKYSSLIFLTSMIITLFQLGCKSPTAPSIRDLSLSVAEAFSTEAWIKLSVSNVALPINLTIKSGNSVLYNLSINSKDSLIYIDSLLPNKTYTLQGYYTWNNIPQFTNRATFTTLDTTSNDFGWQFITIGNNIGSSSLLYDVAVLSDTSAWAVGIIYFKDSEAMYNVVHWDGIKWNPMQLKYFPPGSIGDSITAGGRAIFANNENDIWIVAGTVFHYNGKSWTPYYNNDGADRANRIWSNESGPTWFVGNNGLIVSYYNGVWQKYESGTELDLYDIFSLNGTDLYVSGGDFHDYSGILLKGENGVFHTLEEGRNLSDLSQEFHPYFDGIAATVWASDQKTIFFGGDGFYMMLDSTAYEVKSFPGNTGSANVNGQYYGFISQIRGTGNNDIFMTGQRNTLQHYNGIRWEQIGMPYTYRIDYTWASLSIKNNFIVVVGSSNYQGIVMLLNRK